MYLAESLNAKDLGLLYLLGEPLPEIVALRNGPPVLVHDVVVLLLQLADLLGQLELGLALLGGLGPLGLLSALRLGRLRREVRGEEGAGEDGGGCCRCGMG